MDNSSVTGNSRSSKGVTMVTPVLPIDEEMMNVNTSAKTHTLEIPIGPATAQILDTLTSRVTIASIRSLFSCIGIGEETPFNLPPQAQMLPRMKTNANYFFTNYLLVTAAVFAFLLLFFHPIQLLVCIFITGGWYIVLTKKHEQIGHFVIYGKRIGKQEIMIFATASTVVFLLFFILPEIVFALSTSSVGCALHALLRNNRLKDDSYSSFSHKNSSNSSTATEPNDMV